MIYDTSKLYCGWTHYPNHKPVYMCSPDKPSWYEQVDVYNGVWTAGLCISSIYVKQPAGCMGFAKWFIDNVRDILK